MQTGVLRGIALLRGTQEAHVQRAGKIATVWTDVHQSSAWAFLGVKKWHGHLFVLVKNWRRRRFFLGAVCRCTHGLPEVGASIRTQNTSREPMKMQHSFMHALHRPWTTWTWRCPARSVCLAWRLTEHRQANTHTYVHTHMHYSDP